MTPEEFVLWLQGGRELGAFKDGISKEQAEVIFEHLDLVFNKVTTKTCASPVAKVGDTVKVFDTPAAKDTVQSIQDYLDKERKERTKTWFADGLMPSDDKQLYCASVPGTMLPMDQVKTSTVFLTPSVKPGSFTIDSMTQVSGPGPSVTSMTTGLPGPVSEESTTEEEMATFDVSRVKTIMEESARKLREQKRDYWLGRGGWRGSGGVGGRIC